MIRALAVTTVLATGCARFDLDEPIELVPSPAWTSDQVATLVAAAECWTDGFGIPFEVVDAASAAQVVEIDFNKFACLGANTGGVFSPGMTAQIDVCPSQYWSDHANHFISPLFTVLFHELGHAAGIRVEGHGVSSIMGEANQTSGCGLGEPAFSDEDRDLLHAAAPGFEPTPSCARLVTGFVNGGVGCVCDD